MRTGARRGLAVLVGIVGVAGFAWTWAASSQPSGGDGWRLLGRQRGIGERETVRPVADQAALVEVWDQLLLRDPPRVDFTAEAVVWIVATGTIGCPARLDAIGFDPPGALVTGSFSLGLTAGCDSAIVPDTFVVALDRSRLAPEFEVRLDGP